MRKLLVMMTMLLSTVYLYAGEYTIGTDLQYSELSQKTLGVEFRDKIWEPRKQPFKKVGGIQVYVNFGYGIAFDKQTVAVDKKGNLKSSRNSGDSCPEVKTDSCGQSTDVSDSRTVGSTDNDDGEDSVTSANTSTETQGGSTMSLSGGSDDFYRFRPYMTVEPTVEWKKLTYSLIFGVGYEFGTDGDLIDEKVIGVGGTRIGYTFANNFGVNLEYLRLDNENLTMLNVVRRF